MLMFSLTVDADNACGKKLREESSYASFVEKLAGYFLVQPLNARWTQKPTSKSERRGARADSLIQGSFSLSFVVRMNSDRL